MALIGAVRVVFAEGVGHGQSPVEEIALVVISRNHVLHFLRDWPCGLPSWPY